MLAFINTTLLRLMTAAGELKNRLAEERGQDLMEYALLGGLIAAVAAAALVTAGITGALGTMAGGIAECLDFDDVCPGP